MDLFPDQFPQLVDFDSPLFPTLDYIDFGESASVATESFGYSSLNDVYLDSTMSTPEKRVRSGKPSSGRKRTVRAITDTDAPPTEAAAGPSHVEMPSTLSQVKKLRVEDVLSGSEAGTDITHTEASSKPPVHPASKRPTTRSRKGIQVQAEASPKEPVDARIQERLADLEVAIPNDDLLVDKLREMVASAEAGSDAAEKYQMMLGKKPSRFTNQMYVVEQNSNFVASDYRNLQRINSTWYDKSFKFNKSPFITVNIDDTTLTSAKKLFNCDASRPIDYLSSYRYCVDASTLINESAIFHVDRMYAYWCRHPNPRDDRHPICFRCQLAHSLPICFVHTSWPCDFCLLSSWSELKKRTNRICKLLNNQTIGKSWNSEFHARHKMPARISSQMDALLGISCTKTRMPVSALKLQKLPDAAAGDAAARKATPRKVKRKVTIASSPLSSPVKASEGKTRARRDKFGRPAKPLSKLWYVNARDSPRSDPPEFKHRYRKQIYDAVHTNLAYWAQKHGKDTAQTAFDTLCLARLKYYETTGDRATWIPVGLPDKRSALPEDVLERVMALRDTTATSTDDETASSEKPRPSPGSTARSRLEALQLEVEEEEASGDDDAKPPDSSSSATSFDYEEMLAAADVASKAAEASQVQMPTAGTSSPAAPAESTSQAVVTTTPKKATATTTTSEKAIRKSTPSKASVDTAKTDPAAERRLAVVRSTVHFPDSFRSRPTIHTADSIHPFTSLVVRLAEMEPNKHTIMLDQVNTSSMEGTPFSSHTAGRHCVVPSPCFPEDGELIHWMRQREREMDAADDVQTQKGCIPTITASQEMRVNMADYQVAGVEHLPITAPGYPASSQLEGLLSDPGTLQIKLFPGEAQRLQELARSRARVAQSMRWVLNSALGRQAPGELRDTLHHMLDDVYKLDSEMVVDLNRVQQRASFRLHDFSKTVAQLHGHSVVETHQLFPSCE